MFATFTSAQLPSMPWKNGGGLTREIACLPAGSSVQNFHWRLSIAEIAANGPFSAFAGIDRVITLLEGDGVHLHSASAGIDHVLNVPLAPFAFSGDVALDCDLLGTTCQDFNVMVRRSFGMPQVTVQTQAWRLPAHGALLVREGQWRITHTDGTEYLFDAAGQDGAYWADLPEGSAATPVTADAQLLAVTINPHPAQKA